MSLPAAGNAMKKQHDQPKQEEGNNEAEEWKSKYLRALADYQNLERRTRHEKEEARHFASEVMLERLFPVVDTFDRVAHHVKDTGLTLAMKQLHAVLEEQGVEKIETAGKEFNPHEMECIEVVPGDDTIVVEEVLPGYRLHGKVVRVAHVKVGKKEESV